MQYADGDGGTLPAEFIPGLQQYATVKVMTQTHELPQLQIDHETIAPDMVMHGALCHIMPC